MTNVVDGRERPDTVLTATECPTGPRTPGAIAGQAVARANGKKGGGGTPGKRIKVTDEQIQVITRMKSEGAKVTSIGRATGLSRPTIYSVLAC